MKKFSERFKYLRKKTGLMQKDFVKEFNNIYHRAFTPAAISLYENGKRLPEIDALIDFAKYFNVSIDYLLGIDTESYETKVLEKIDGLSSESKKDLDKYIELLALRDAVSIIQSKKNFYNN